MRSRISTYAVGALVAAALVAAAFLWIVLYRAPARQTAPVSVAPAAASNLTPPPNSKEYQSTTYRFSLYYPDDLTVSEQQGASGSMVVLFRDQMTGQGFDIFIVPYDEPKITQATFLMDEPSGVMNDPQNITIDGAAATEFFGTNPAMDASREIWFLRGGFLYEVTAPQPLDSWLLQIMETWKFT
jgi:hypothetical protein